MIPLVALALVHILPGPLPERLNEWSRMSGYGILGDYAAMKVATTSEVRCGCDDSLHILALMMRGTGFRYVRTNYPRMLSVIRVEAGWE